MGTDPSTLPAFLSAGTSVHRSQSCRCTQVGSRGVVALGARTHRSPSCSAERCRVGTCIPTSQSSSVVGPAAGRGEKGELRPPAQRSSKGCASWALICTWLRPNPALGPPQPGSTVPHPWARAGTHHVDNVKGEDLDAAHDSGERADDGGEDGQATDTEEEILGSSGVSCRARRARPGVRGLPREPLYPPAPPP